MTGTEDSPIAEPYLQRLHALCAQTLRTCGSLPHYNMQTILFRGIHMNFFRTCLCSSQPIHGSVEIALERMQVYF
jgi:hypothetical protein